MTHAEILAAISQHGGRLVASFVLDAHGRTEGQAYATNRPSRCGACHRVGHSVKRCTGPDTEPRPRWKRT